MPDPSRAIPDIGPPRPDPDRLPRGLVAFLFTDIEGSTRLWEADAAVMWRALARHNALLAAAVDARGGVWFKTVGDAMQAAFPDAAAALAAAVDAQRALAAEPWPETGPIRVRMAIHAGEAEPAHGDYLAPCLNRLARLLSTGYGSQVLLTDDARTLVAGRLPAGVDLRDLGRHRLRDLLEPEQVWQPVIPGLPDAFPPLKSLETHPTNLPVQPTALIGREGELAALLPLLRDPATRLLTLTGPGGSGKTRLALQLAADSLDAFPDGAFLVDLAALDDPALLLPEIAATLGIREGGGLSLAEALNGHLAAKRILLLLDNLEQFRPQADAGRTVAGLLAAAPGLTVLATSRAPLRIRAEREWPLAGLSVPDTRRPLPAAVLAENPAVALFVERAQAAKPAFALDDANAADVAAICAALDGLPLAIELAAARIRALGPRQIRERLGGRIDLLAARAADRPDRQQTLAAAIDWSHDLLAEDERAVFRRLSVFAGGASLEAIEGVLDTLGEPRMDALDGVTRLLEESLVRTEETPAGEPRYRMLETIRAYARERLEEAGEMVAARAAHLAWFTAWATAADAELVDDRTGVLDGFETDHDNLRAALDWAIAHGEQGDGVRLASRTWHFWEMRGHLSEGRRWLDRALDADTGGVTRWRGGAMAGSGTLAWRQGDLRAAERDLRQALAMAEQLDDLPSVASACANLGNVLDHLGELDQAEACHRRSLELARQAGHRPNESMSLNNLALIAHARGDLAGAKEMLAESLAIKTETGAESGMPNTLTNLAVIAVDEGDLDAADAYLERSLEIDRRLGNAAGIADDLGNLGAIAAMREDTARAARWHHEALLLRHDLGDWLSIAWSFETIAGTAAQAGRHEDTARLFGAAEALRDALHAPVPATERERYWEGVDAARAALPPETFDAAWSEGRALDRDAAVALALATSAEIAGTSGPTPEAAHSASLDTPRQSVSVQP